MVAPFNPVLPRLALLLLPLLVAAFELIFMRAGPRSICARAAAFVAVPVTFGVWTRVVLGHSDLETTVGAEAGGPAAYALAQAKAHLVYFFNFAWPVNMRQMPLLTPPAGWADPAVLFTFAMVAISASLSDGSFLKDVSPMDLSMWNGGISRDAVRALMARAHGRASSYVISDIGAISPAR